MAKYMSKGRNATNSKKKNVTVTPHPAPADDELTGPEHELRIAWHRSVKLGFTVTPDSAAPSKHELIKENLAHLERMIGHELGLIGTRMSWFAISQSFLFSAYVTTIGAIHKPSNGTGTEQGTSSILPLSKDIPDLLEWILLRCRRRRRDRAGSEQIPRGDVLSGLAKPTESDKREF
jgi:hypothetical protein